MIALALRMSLFYFFPFWTKKAFEVSPNMLKCLIYLWWFAQFTHSHIVSSNFHFTFPSKTSHILAYRQCNELGQFTRLGIHFIDVEITFSLFNIVTTYKSAGAKTTKSNPVRLNIDLWYILNVKASLFCKEFFHISFVFLYFSRHKQEKFHLPAPATFFIMFSPSPSLPPCHRSFNIEWTYGGDNIRFSTCLSIPWQYLTPYCSRTHNFLHALRPMGSTPGFYGYMRLSKPLWGWFNEVWFW